MIVVERIAPDGTAHRVSIGVHEVVADMTPPAGENAGPDPHDLYDSALGACKALTMLWYAQHNGIPLDDIHVGVTRDASAERAGTYKLTTRIAISGNLTDAQREKLHDVARKCPIHKLMTEVTTQIDTIFIDERTGRSEP
ncbi:osmotically inducible protein OsmC [Sphingobium sp. SCG-1]|uniref:OsmC family protein n=1 Tax=Sphingobium sp. SCG-1 TaxID=2072936 RepID=UPI000CD69A78|nr:OsmC family protein [Sphingobium sp. SCG-1]AUW59861.1 osmotically inducible protein OsmC [Sphingobium sp. SCG-1]